MNSLDNVVPVYLDQNILSHLRDGKNARDELVRLLRKLQDRNMAYVYSMTHVDECRGSEQPEQFVKVMEDLPVYFMDFESASNKRFILSLDKAHRLLLEPEDEAHRAKRLIEDLLKIWHFASGWLGEVEVQELKDDMAREMADFWDVLKQDVEWGALGADLEKTTIKMLNEAQKEMVAQVENLPFDETREEWQNEFAKLRERLPANYAQLDEVPNEDAVSFVLSCLDDGARKEIERQFPQGFWSELEGRETGVLAGLAFLLFMCGLVRDRRVKKKGTECRMQYFRGQFRDGVHIENAAKCAAFITCDERAARLARSLYAYAGVTTEVIWLQIKDNAG
jgi:hypothetical protein